MNFLVLLIPTLVLGVTLAAYAGIREETGRYVRSLREMCDSRERIMKMQFVKELVRFFGTSRTSEDIEALMDRIASRDDGLDERMMKIANDAGPEIGTLDSYLGQMNRMNESVSNVRTLLATMGQIILVWGVVVSVGQYIVLVSYFLKPSFNYLAEANTIFLSSVIPLAGAVVIMYMHVNAKVRGLALQGPV